MPILFLRLRRTLPALASLLTLASAAAASTPVAARAQAAANPVGFRATTAQDPVSGGRMPVMVFYPAAGTDARDAHATTRRGVYDIAALADAAPAAGAKPLVVLSHGNGGSNLGHHDLAAFLAAHGFIVAAPQHPGDNFRDTGGVGTAAVLVGRPVQVSATISALLADPQWKPLIDPARIGVAGFSAGGYTSLMAVGAVPRFERFLGYCERHPEDPGICGGAKRKSAELAARGTTPEAYMSGMQAELGRWGPTRDPRVRAAFVMAPLSLLFDREGLAAIDRPVYLVYGEQDHVLRPDENAARIRPLIPTLVGVRTIPKADHWVFLPPCSKALANEAPDICGDPPGVDRAGEHARIDAEALAFFRKTLAAPSR